MRLFLVSGRLSSSRVAYNVSVNTGERVKDPHEAGQPQTRKESFYCRGGSFDLIIPAFNADAAIRKALTLPGQPHLSRFHGIMSIENCNEVHHSHDHKRVWDETTGRYRYIRPTIHPATFRIHNGYVNAGLIKVPSKKETKASQQGYKMARKDYSPRKKMKVPTNYKDVVLQESFSRAYSWMWERLKATKKVAKKRVAV